MRRETKTDYWALAWHPLPNDSHGESLTSEGFPTLDALHGWIAPVRHRWGSEEGFELHVYRRDVVGGSFVDHVLAARPEGNAAVRDPSAPNREEPF